MLLIKKYTTHMIYIMLLIVLIVYAVSNLITIEYDKLIIVDHVMFIDKLLNNLYKYPVSPDKIDDIIYRISELEEIENMVNTSPDYIELGTFEITAYTTGKESCGEFSDGKTALNMEANYTHKIIASDWDVIPPHTDIFIKGMGWYTVRDKGKDIKGKRLDILMKNVSDARKFGRQKLVVWMRKPIRGELSS